jgi:hypothetical protein
MLAFALLAASVVPSQAASFQSGPARVRLVELYSSEGCSSCPPADEWMSSLTKDAGLWKEFVPVAFHVDYWDYLGWKDRFGSPAFSARQRAYAASWDSGSVYTPGLVLDGLEFRGWSAGVRASAEQTGVLDVELTDGKISLRFLPTAEPATLDAFIARLGSGMASDVTAGENSGRVLRHDFVVRGLTRVRLEKKREGWTARVALPAGSGPRPTREAVAVWVTGPDGRPLQATGGPLP